MLELPLNEPIDEPCRVRFSCYYHARDNLTCVKAYVAIRVVLAILIALIGCTSSQTGSDHSFVELVKIEPAPGSIVSADTVLVATLRYRIDKPEHGLTYYLQPAFGTVRRTPLYEPIFDLHAQGANVPLRISQGEIITSFRLGTVYANHLLRRPIKVKYWLLAGRGVGLADRILGSTENISYGN